MQTYANRARRWLVSKTTLAYKSLKSLSRPSKKKGIQKWAGIVVESGKWSEAAEKDFSLS